MHKMCASTTIQNGCVYSWITFFQFCIVFAVRTVVVVVDVVSSGGDVAGSYCNVGRFGSAMTSINSSICTCHRNY